MKKHDDSLFQIGEVTKLMGITRKTLLVYEEAGLLNPSVKDKDSGYRYYSADDITQIRAIRSLQSLGLTLKEVGEYLFDTENIDAHLQRLMDIRAALDRNIHLLQLRAARRGDMTVRRTTLPKQICYCKEFPYRGVAQATSDLREAFLAAAHTGKMSTASRMFTLRTGVGTAEPKLLCCLPVDSSFDGPERVEFAETSALCIYYRGPYEGLSNAMQALDAYVRKNGVEMTGPFRSIYLEGPPNRGKNSEDYITQVAVPIR